MKDPHVQIAALRAAVSAALDLALAEPMRTSGQALGRKRVAERPRRVREVTDGHTEAPAPVQLPNPDQSDGGLRIVRARKSRRSFQDLRVRIKEEHATGVARHESAVVRVREAAATAVHQSYAREGVDDIRSGISRLCVDRDHIQPLRAHVGEESVQTGGGVERIVVRADDCGVIQGGQST
jgi:hypothetical protein